MNQFSDSIKEYRIKNFNLPVILEITSKPGIGTGLDAPTVFDLGPTLSKF